MALPIDRCINITKRAGLIIADFQKELILGPSPKRLHEIERDEKLIRLILKSIWQPHADELRQFMDEDILEDFGL